MFIQKLKLIFSWSATSRFTRILIASALLISNWLFTEAFAAVPSAPTGLTGSPVGSQIRLTWTAPNNTGNPDISDYQVEFSTNNSTWTVFNDGVSTNTSATPTALTASTTYSFRVAAVNSHGTGAYSSVLTNVQFCTNLNGMNGNNGQALPGLILWLRADCVDGTPTRPNDDTDVTTWRDISGQGNNATSDNTDRPEDDNASRHPRFRSDSNFLINDLPVINFTRDTGEAGTNGDVSGSRFIVDNIDIRATTLPDVSIFVVYKPRRVDGDASDILGVWGVDNGAWDRFFLAKFIQTSINGLDDGLISLGPGSSGLSESRVADAGLDGVTRLLTAIYDGNVSGGTNQGPTDGSEIYFGSDLVTSFTDSTHPTDARTDLYIGWDGDGSSFRGDIAEFIIFDRALDDALPTIREYLNDRYRLGLAVSTNLPSVLLVDPKNTSKNLPTLELSDSTNAMICLNQVANAAGDALSGSADIDIDRSSNVSGITATIGTNSWRYSGTRADVSTQISSIRVNGVSGNPLVDSSPKWLRIRVTASRTDCDSSPVSRVVELRPLGLDGFRRVTVTVN